MYRINKTDSEHRIVEIVRVSEEDTSTNVISEFPGYPIDDYKYINGQVVYDPRTDRPVYDPKAPTEVQTLKGIVAALAMVTGHMEVLKNVKL